MSRRLQVLVPAELDAQLLKAAPRSRVSKGEWVRRALQESLRRASKSTAPSDPLARLGALNAPTEDIQQMLAEIVAGREHENRAPARRVLERVRRDASPVNEH